MWLQHSWGSCCWAGEGAQVVGEVWCGCCWASDGVWVAGWLTKCRVSVVGLAAAGQGKMCGWSVWHEYSGAVAGQVCRWMARQGWKWLLPVGGECK